MKFNLRNILTAGKNAVAQLNAPAQAPSAAKTTKVSNANLMGQKIGGVGKWAYNAPSDLLSGIEQNLTGSSGKLSKDIGMWTTHLGAGAYLANLAAKKMTGTSLTEKLTGESETIVPQETQKWRKKAESEVLQNVTPRGFDAGALDLAHNASDEGWRAGIKAFGKDEFNKLAKQAVTSGDAESLYNAVVKKSMASGKKVNFSKPLYIPAMFSKDGKKYGYAIVKGEDGATPKLVKIELGKGVVYDQ